MVFCALRTSHNNAIAELSSFVVLQEAIGGSCKEVVLPVIVLIEMEDLAGKLDQGDDSGLANVKKLIDMRNK